MKTITVATGGISVILKYTKEPKNIVYRFSPGLQFIFSEPPDRIDVAMSDALAKRALPVIIEAMEGATHTVVDVRGNQVSVCIRVGDKLTILSTVEAP